MQLEILCPKCNWKPGADSFWQCTCGCRWNTFNTAGKCPNCCKVWKDTQCQHSYRGGCGKWSKHIDWYRNLGDEMRKEIEKILNEQPAAI